ncbi:bacterio-opsin activator [Thermocrinis jamiesonii]|jgi:probable regulatory domain|uniref:bacterio-opsin activator n=1 Tax=Thermocrinis jamiesonii TaxID=1302351 RepID=UPI00049518B6|nr:bacterio-opsin activator [Thermocrinis jamiesonii]
MVIEITEVQAQQMDVKSLENLTARVFLKAIDLLGGLSKLTEYRTLTWLPSMARAAFVVVLKNEYLKTDEEIAQIVGITKNTVRGILRADPALALEKIKKLEELTKEESKELKVHTAGGIVKLAYKLVSEGQEADVFVSFCNAVAEDVCKVLDIPWAYMVLKYTKGVKYPIQESSVLQEKLKGLKIKDNPAEEVVKKLHYPIKTPAMLLHEIKLAISEISQ